MNHIRIFFQNQVCQARLFKSFKSSSTAHLFNVHWEENQDSLVYSWLIDIENLGHALDPKNLKIESIKLIWPYSCFPHESDWCCHMGEEEDDESKWVVFIGSLLQATFSFSFHGSSVSWCWCCIMCKPTMRKCLGWVDFGAIFCGNG